MTGAAAGDQDESDLSPVQFCKVRPVETGVAEDQSVDTTSDQQLESAHLFCGFVGPCPRILDTVGDYAAVGSVAARR
ncbi:hypothetical protein MHAEM_08766, partial [Mycolicibacterium phlei]|nr:hypothetical protein [Mycolicibacterium phlei]